jgi:hypothetical protein
MKKKPILKRRRKITGGESLLDKITGKVEGSLITDNIENAVILKRKGELIDEYKRRKENAEKRALDTKLAYDELEKNLQLEHDRNLKRNELDFKKSNATIRNIGNSISWSGDKIITITLFLFNFLGKLFFTIIRYIGKFVITLSKSNSPVIKTICLIIVIMIILMLIFSILGLTKPANKFDFKKPTSTDIFKQTKLPNMSDYMDINTFSFDNFNIFKNYFNRMVGNDTIGNSADNQLRETINNGRWDGIYHCNSNDYNVYSMIKPKPLTVNVDINKYPNSDYFKLPKVVREGIYNNSANAAITIPVYNSNMNGNNRYIYKFNDAHIGSVVANRVIFPLFADVDENYHIANDIPLDDFTFTDGDNINKDVLAAKMFSYKDDKFVYPMDYINNKIK